MSLIINGKEWLSGVNSVKDEISKNDICYRL